MARGVFIRRIPVVVAVLMMMAGTARARDRMIELDAQDVGVDAVPSERITRAKAKKVLSEGRRAYARVANRLALNSASVFFTGSPLPCWMKETVRKDPRIRIHLSDRLRVADMGAEAYLLRMGRGDYLIYVRGPEDDPTPEDLARLWREMAYAVIGNSAWHAAPLWLREGIAETMAEQGAGKDPKLADGLKEQLRERAGTLDVSAVLASTERDEWAAHGGRAVSWALVHLLDMENRKLLPSLFNQSRLLICHLMAYRSTQTVRKEYTGIVQEQLERSGYSAEILQRMLALWIREEFATDSAYRRSEANKVVKKAVLPKHFGFGMQGRFGPRSHIEDAYGTLRHYQPFNGGQIVWRLPFTPAIEVWVGVRGKPGTNYALRPSRSKEGYYMPYPIRNPGPEGKRTLNAATMELPRQTTKYGFLWACVSSPASLGYLFQREYLLK